MSGGGAALERVRAACLALPETSERLSHGAPTFFIRDSRAFVTYHDDHHGDGRLALFRVAEKSHWSAARSNDHARFFQRAGRMVQRSFSTQAGHSYGRASLLATRVLYRHLHGSWSGRRAPAEPVACAR